MLHLLDVLCFILFFGFHHVPLTETIQSTPPGSLFVEDVVVDLGSGTGRVVLAAALAFPFLFLGVFAEVLPGFV